MYTRPKMAKLPNLCRDWLCGPQCGEMGQSSRTTTVQMPYCNQGAQTWRGPAWLWP